jgi:ABC-type spermidine/putrescine transport system permease subunit I
LLAGSILVFIPALGEFVIPDILGGSTEVYIGNLLAQQFLSTRNWPLGAAISLVLLVIILSLFALFRHLQKDHMDDVLI